MKYSRCHVCPYFKPVNQCHFLTNEMRKEGKTYKIMRVGIQCPLREDICEYAYEAPISEPEIIKEKSDKEKLQEFKSFLYKRGKELL